MKSTNSANWILVTGTSTGLGRAATLTLAENGYRVLAPRNRSQRGRAMPGPMIAAYQAAKAAFEAVSDSMRIEFSPSLPKSLQPVYADALRAFAKTVASSQRFPTSPAKASLTILLAVTASRPRTRYLIGTDAKLSAFLKRNLPDRWMDAIIFRLVGLPRRVKHQEGE